MRIKAQEPPPAVVEPTEPTETFTKNVEEFLEETGPSEPLALKPEKKWTTMKIIVLVCLVNGIAWVWCSYILAWLGKEQIAESLSQVALTEIIGVVLVYAVKSVFENLSKNNSWPDKPGSDPPDGAG